MPRTYTKKLVKAAPVALSQTKKLIKSIILKNAETKYKTLALEKVELNHNTLSSMVNMTGVFPSQNDTDGGREGDEIVSQGVRIRLMLGQKLDRPNVSYRIFITSFDYSTTGAVVPTYGEFFHSVSGNGMLDPVQYKRWKIHKSILLKSKGTSMNVGTAGKEFIRTLKLWIPIRKKLKFRADATDSVVNFPNNFRIFIIPYDAYGTLTTDNIAYVQGAVTLYYKDP